jgi:hypothetical protein
MFWEAAKEVKEAKGARSQKERKRSEDVGNGIFTSLGPKAKTVIVWCSAPTS